MNREFVLIRLYRLGDLLMATALARAWKAEEPTHLTWIVGEECAGLLRGQPFIDRLIVVPGRFIERFLHRTSFGEGDGEERFPVEAARAEFPQVFAALPERADRVVNLQFNTAAAILAGAIRTEERAGPYAGEDGRKCVDDPWSQYYLATGADIRFSIVHWVDAFLHIGGARREDPATMFLLRPDPVFGAAFERARNGVPYFVVQVGSYEDQKRWDEMRYAAAAAEIAKATGRFVVLVGGRAERVLCLRVERALEEAGVPCLTLAGRTDFHQLGQVLVGADVVLGNDTFTQHFAAALDVGAVTVFQGDPSPWLTLAYRRGNRAVAEDDGSPPSVERVVGAALGTRHDFLHARRLHGYQFPMPVDPKSATEGWRRRWIVGCGHLRALDPTFPEGKAIRAGYPQWWVDRIEAAIDALERGEPLDPASVDRALLDAEPHHPLKTLLVMLMVKNRYAAASGDPSYHLGNYRWALEALARAGQVE